MWLPTCQREILPPPSRLMLANLGTWKITQSEKWNGSGTIGVAGFESGMGEGGSCLSGPSGSVVIENGKQCKEETWLTCTPQIAAVFSLETLVHTTICGKMTHKTIWILVPWRPDTYFVEKMPVRHSVSCELTSDCSSNYSTCLFCSDVFALTRNVALDSHYVTGNTWLWVIIQLVPRINNLAPMLRLSGTIPVLFHMPSWLVQGRLYLYAI